jgi:hypothetical protein
MGRIERSLQLVSESYKILMQDKELMILPLLSGLFMTVVVLIIALGSVLGSAAELDAPRTIAIFLGYVVLYSIGLFFQAAVVIGATERMNGGDPTVQSALAGALQRASQIVAWAIVAATVGMLLRAIQERVGFLGRIVTGFLGVAWSLATFFIVPVLVLEDRSIKDSFSRSVTVFRETWGETFVGSGGIGLVSFIAWLALILVTVVLALVGAWILAIFVFAAGAIALLMLFSALQGIYVAALYRFATHGDGGGFNSALLKQAFVPK